MPKVTKAGLRPEALPAEAAFIMRVKEGDEVLAERRYELSDCPTLIRAGFEVHGAQTLLQQRTSDIKEDPMAKFAAMDPVWERFCEGEWKAEKRGGARTVAPIIEVLAAKKGASIAATQKAYAALPDETKEAILKKFADEVKAVVAKRSEADEVDLSGLVD